MVGVFPRLSGLDVSGAERWARALTLCYFYALIRHSQDSGEEDCEGCQQGLAFCSLVALERNCLCRL